MEIQKGDTKMAVAKKVNIKNIKPNPHRNFDIDPIDWDKVDVLVQSYKELTDFGVLPMRAIGGGQYELAAGHHRLEAMRKLDLKEVDAKVMQLDTMGMIQTMARENMTQKGATAFAVQDAMAASTEFLAYELLKYKNYEQFQEVSKVSPIVDTKPQWTQCLNTINKGEGLGERLLSKFTGGSTSKRGVEEALKSLKADGTTLTIVNKVLDRLNLEAEQATAEAEKAAAEAEADRLAEIEAEEAEAERLAEEEAAAAIQAAKDEEEAEAAKVQAEEKKLEREEQNRLRAEEEALEEEERQAAAAIKAEEEEKAKQEREDIREAAEKALIAKIDGKALKLFPNSGHQAAFLTLLKENIDLFPKKQHVPLAESIIMRAKYTNKRRATDPSRTSGRLTVDGIKMAFNSTIREGKIWTKQMQKEQEARLKAAEDKKEAEDLGLKVDNLENELRTNTRKLEKTVIKYTKLVKEEPEAETLVNIFKYKQDIRKLINALVAFDSMFGGKITDYFDDIKEVKD
ncbi:MAG: hypothetical protein DRJ03_02515 [Chloroflexi bacterium]|nr:MAG: hypothetical protein DRJ03_02515 [Chloroflexota bacterium]